MLDIDGARTAIREEGLDGWLFLTMQHRDEIADAALDISRESTNTRPWAFLVRAEGEPVRIVHEIEPSILEHLPGPIERYYARGDFHAALARALPPGSRVAAQFSPDIPVGSFLDHGTALMIQALGVTLVSSAGLVARCLGAVDAAGARSHDEAALVLFDAVADAWARIVRAFEARAEVTEAGVRAWVSERLSSAGLVSDAPPLVAAGTNSANPHYAVRGDGAVIRPGDVVQFDVWARQDTAQSVYADISWVGVASPRPSEPQREAFAAVVQAREAALWAIGRALAEGRAIRGRDADEAARAVIERLGFGRGLRHRTGHSIGRRVHGYGVNLDCIEFPDDRPLREGACFSVEPGIYLEGFGMRTEVDCSIRNGSLVVTGRERQRALLTLRSGPAGEDRHGEAG
jgi:Xaa-Pro dipeptidase